MEKVSDDRENTSRTTNQPNGYYMAYSVLNNTIAGVSKNGDVVGAFKFVHLYQGILKQIVYENFQGAAVPKRDDNDEIVKKDVPGFTLHFQYKNTSGKWSGSLIENDVTGEYMTKGCIRVDVTLPKILVNNAKLTQLLLLLGVAKKDEITVMDESLLTDDASESDDMSLEDLENDTDVDEQIIDTDLRLENIFEDIIPFINRVFTAPFTKNDKGYPQVCKDFSKWILVPKKSK